MIKIQKIKIALVACILSLVAVPVFAAELFYEIERREVRVGTEFKIGIFLNTEKENINAIEGIVQFPGDLLEFKELNDANSIINFWVERPRFQEKNQIIFSGITPGGFLGERGLIFTAVFLAKNEGVDKMKIQNIRAFLNDGKGTAADISASPLEIVVTSQALPLPVKEEEKDKEPPESFVPKIAADPNVFDGKMFLVFATQDKKSGIDYFKVKETRQRILTMLSKWIPAESPYVLQDQDLRSYVFVRAVDKAGNTRVEKISPQNPLRWYENFENWIIIIFGLVIAYYVMRKLLWKKNTN